MTTTHNGSFLELEAEEEPVVAWPSSRAWLTAGIALLVGILLYRWAEKFP